MKISQTYFLNMIIYVTRRSNAAFVVHNTARRPVFKLSYNTQRKLIKICGFSICGMGFNMKISQKYFLNMIYATRRSNTAFVVHNIARRPIFKLSYSTQRKLIKICGFSICGMEFNMKISQKYF